jgi:hypothetical protein
MFDQAGYNGSISSIERFDLNDLRITVMPNPSASFTSSKFWPQIIMVMSGVSIYSIFLLFTGCSLALISQHMANQGMAMNQAQLPAWTRYTMNFLLSWLVEVLLITSKAVQSLQDSKRKAVCTHVDHTPLPDSPYRNVSLRQGLLLIGMG